MAIDHIPLADLHRHLDGSIRPETLNKLARDKNTFVPDDLKFFPNMGLEQALARFAFTLSLLQEAKTVKHVANEICEDALTEGVTTLEIRFAPQLHKGASVEQIVDSALEGINGRAGLILCGLYGESPSMLTKLVEIAKKRIGVVGIDLAGGPVPNHKWKLEDYAQPFTLATNHSLGRTVHVSEGRSPREIHTAINKLHAQRLGHATTLLEDPKAVELVVENNIVIEACLTSNFHTGVIKTIDQHPLPVWLKNGIKVCICTDNTFLSDVTAKVEYSRVSSLPGINESQITTLIETGHKAAFKLIKE